MNNWPKKEVISAPVQAAAICCTGVIRKRGSSILSSLLEFIIILFELAYLKNYSNLSISIYVQCILWWQLSN